MNETNTARTLLPGYALRAWLGALLAQTRRARESVEARIEASEKETARLRRQHERAGTVIESLQDAIGKVDAQLRRVRDVDLERNETEHVQGQAQPIPEHPEGSDVESGPQSGGEDLGEEPDGPAHPRGGRRRR